MHVTIKPKVGYRVRRIKSTPINQGFVDTLGYDIPVTLFDGDDAIMVAGIRSKQDYIDECKNGGDETARFCECFKTNKGNTFVYWRCEELDDDYLTMIEKGST